MMDIVHKQDEFVVIEKPSGMSVHNEVNGDVVSILSEELSSTVYAVHRLDRMTSGLLLCTTRPEMICVLQEALRTSTKKYQAIVRGVVSSQKGEWRHTITNTSEGRRNPRGRKQYRKSAHTSYEVLSYNQYISMLSLTLHTGRQHQIRKHCVLAGHEIIGDTRYGDTRYQKKMQERYDFDGLFLHAYSLQFSLFTKSYDFRCVPNGWERLGLRRS
ncbi:MAG: hypothetical protein CL916_04095 [Deltaproteobacteria bacterium]|nr:hypothetical protein [Deltaproteobacteria bacterium]